MCLKVIVSDLNWQLKKKHLFLENLILVLKYFFLNLFFLYYSTTTVLIYTTQMAAKQKHRIAGNPYNLCKRVEIPEQIQLEDDSAFLNEFASQPIPGQVSDSKTGSDTDSTSTDDSIGLNISGVVYSESDFEESPIVRHRKHFKDSIQHPVASTSKMSDQRGEKFRIKHSSTNKSCLNWTRLVRG